MTLSDTAETTPASGTSVGSNPDFRRYIVARFIWVMATQITNIAVGWLVYDVSQSALALGLVGLAAFAPRLVVVFVSGLVSDRFDRRLVICSCFAVNALAGLALMLVATSDPVPLGWVYVIFTFSGTARGFAGPAVQSLTPTLVSRDQLSRALSLTASVSQTAVIVGPALGGLLYTFGPIAPFSVAVMGFLVAIALLLTIAPRGSASGKAPVKLSDVFAGFVFIRRRPIILGAISLDMMSVLFGGVVALLPIVAADVLEIGPSGLGILRSMPAVGAVMVSAWLSYMPIRRHAGPKLFGAVIVFGLATICFGLSSNLILSLLMLWIIGASDVISVVIRQTLVQGDTPNEIRGRVSAVNSLFLGASNELGEFESGATAALFGLVPAIVLGGIGTISVAVLWALMFPQLRKRDALVDP